MTNIYDVTVTGRYNRTFAIGAVDEEAAIERAKDRAPEEIEDLEVTSVERVVEGDPDEGDDDDGVNDDPVLDS